MKAYEHMSREELLDVIHTMTSNMPTALQEREERLRAILQTAVEGIITIDERGIIESINPAAEKIFGYASDEVIGKNVTMLMPSPDREKHDGYLENYRRTGQAKIIGIGREVVGQRKDGNQFPMDLSVSEVKFGERRLFTGFVRDISERKQLEKVVLEISDREQRRIGQDLHDGLGQHLTGIELRMQLLEQKLSGKRFKAESASVSEISGFVRDAINQTRRLARGLAPVVLKSGGLLAALRELCLHSEQMFHIECALEIEPPVIVEDVDVATHLYRVAQEAISNAVKHGRSKTVRLALHEERGNVTLEIEDRGKGLPTPLPEFRGMGLRIMQYRAGIIGASLAIANNPEGGARIVCTWPRKHAHGQQK
jgi:two-component system, LuxR family, sensor kinase FixL